MVSWTLMEGSRLDKNGTAAGLPSIFRTPSIGLTPKGFRPTRRRRAGGFVLPGCPTVFPFCEAGGPPLLAVVPGMAAQVGLVLSMTRGRVQVFW